MLVLTLALLLLAGVFPASAQQSRAPLPPRADGYDARFMFTRLRYQGGNPCGGSSLRGFGGGGYGRGGYDAWNHDYPNADLNMQTVLKEATSTDPVIGTSLILDLEDPAIFQHPILYMSEPGFWKITDKGAKNLREHLLKGGFIIFDDFDGPCHWESWLAQIERVLPGYTPIEIDGTHPVFHTFFGIDDVYVPNPMIGNAVKPTYLGIFEDNDPTKRMLALVNYNADLAEYWEQSTSTYLLIDLTNDAFRIGVNYFIYGLTH
jgi:hypothetical protein